jgi:hypothetical protein
MYGPTLMFGTQVIGYLIRGRVQGKPPMKKVVSTKEHFKII